jgi:uncharacterized protein (TIGR03118 family)
MRNLISSTVVLGLLLCTGLMAQADPDDSTTDGYIVTDLVTDGGKGSLTAAHTDPHLVNPWGIVFNPNGAVWVADNGTGLSTLYDGNGVIQPLVVTIPGPASDPDCVSTPNGIVFNSDTGPTGDFLLGPDATNPAIFLFSTEDGTISGWNPAAAATRAIIKVDRSSENAVYKGLAIAADGTSHFLYATDFHNARVDVFDEAFRIATTPGGFIDPTLPAGFAPFGIQNILGDLYVTFAQQDAAKHDNVSGAGLGFVDVFSPQGRLVKRLISRGRLNAPWGLALAPADFGKFGSRLLVGNFGDSVINAFDARTGEHVGSLRTPRSASSQQGLWGISFGNGVDAQPTNTLFFASGTNDENNGLYGRIDVASAD